MMTFTVIPAVMPGGLYVLGQVGSAENLFLAKCCSFTGTTISNKDECECSLAANII